MSPQETKDEDLDRLVQSHCRLDLTSPMPGCSENQRRYLLYEGDLKLKEGFASKVCKRRESTELKPVKNEEIASCHDKAILRTVGGVTQLLR